MLGIGKSGASAGQPRMPQQQPMGQPPGQQMPGTLPGNRLVCCQSFPLTELGDLSDMIYIQNE